MRSLAMVLVLVSPTAASAYTFGDWASDHGIFQADVMPRVMRVGSETSPPIDGLNGISGFDWTTTPTETLYLYGNQISSIEPHDFTGLTNLTRLFLSGNQISSIEPGTFSGLTNLEYLYLGGNIALTELNLDEADFSNLTEFDVGDNVNITSVSLRNTVVNQTSLAQPLCLLASLTMPWKCRERTHRGV